MNVTNMRRGGTFFADTGETYSARLGGMLSFPGELLHAGACVEEGVRYVVAGFLYVEEHDDKNFMLE